MTQAQIAELFQRERSVVSKHISNVQILHIASLDMPVKLYHISVGYRVKPLRGVHFRRWATARLKEYMLKGFTMDDERLESLGGGHYWKELLDRMRDLRSWVLMGVSWVS